MSETSTDKSLWLNDRIQNNSGKTITILNIINIYLLLISLWPLD